MASTVCEHPTVSYKVVATRKDGVQRIARCLVCGASAVTWGAHWPVLGTVVRDDA